MGRITNDFVSTIEGSVFTKASNDLIVPPTDHIYVGFTTLSATLFTALTAEDPNRHANTAHAAGDLTADAETVNEGSGGVQMTAGGSGDAIPANCTIYGRYTGIDVHSGSLIAYFARDGK